MEQNNEERSSENGWALKKIGGKPLFDWLGLTAQGAVPIFLAILTLVQSHIATTKNEQDKQRADEKSQQDKQRADERSQKDKEIAKDNQMQAIMSGYLTQMTNLILREDLQRSNKTSQAAVMARAITLNASRQLDQDRKGQLLKFLYEANLLGRCQIVASQQPDYQCQKSILDLNGIKLEATTFDRPVPLPGIDLMGASLPNANLIGIDLTKANLTTVNLMCATLTDASLEKANLESAILLNSELAFARLPAANLENALLQNANLKGANLDGAILNGADLQNANLQTAKLQDAKLGNSFSRNNKKWHNTQLQGADLSRANLQRAVLENADLTGANLAGANLTNAKLTGANLKDVFYNLETKFPEGFNPANEGMRRLEIGQLYPVRHSMPTKRQCET